MWRRTFSVRKNSSFVPLFGLSTDPGFSCFLLSIMSFWVISIASIVVKAFQNTSMTSIMLLDCWAIPCVLVLTWVFLKTRYRLMKISGVVICIVGVVMVVFSDVHAGDRAGNGVNWFITSLSLIYSYHGFTHLKSASKHSHIGQETWFKNIMVAFRWK